MWNIRGNAPFLLRKEALVGSWSLQAYVDATAITFGSGQVAILGITVVDTNNLIGFNGTRLTYHIYPGGEPHLTCDYAGQGGVCGMSRIPGGVKRAWMRVQYSMEQGTYTMMYRFAQADDWSIQAVIREEIMPFGGKVWAPKVGFFIKAWNAPRAYQFDVSQVRFTSAVSRAVRTRSLYFRYEDVNAGPVFVPLARHVMYRLSAASVAADGSSNSSEVPAPLNPVNPALVVGPPRPQALPNVGTPPSLAMDMTSQAPQRNAHFVRGSFGSPDAWQPSDAVRPRIVHGVHYDRGALVCAGDKWTNVANPLGLGPGVFAPADMSAVGYTLLVVARLDPASTVGVLVGKGATTESTQGFSLSVSAGLSSMGFRVVQPPLTTVNKAAVTYNATLDRAQIHLWSFRVSLNGTNTFSVLGRLNGAASELQAGGFGTVGNSFGPALRPGNAPFRLCAGEGTAGSFFQGSLLDVFAFKTSLDDNATSVVERALLDKHYLRCPPQPPVLTADTLATSGCPAGVPLAQCTQACAANMTRVVGALPHTCTRGVWSGRTAVCGAACPALQRPATATGCTRVLQWEPFALGSLYNDTSGVFPRLPPTNGGAFSTTLDRFSVFPSVPDVAVTDIFNVVAAEAAASVLTRHTAMRASYDVGAEYDPLAVWRAKDDMAPAARGPLVALKGVAPDAATGLLTANSYKTPSESPYADGYVMFNTRPAWVTDAANNPAQGSYWYSARVRPVSEVAGLAFRISSGAQLNFLAPGTTSYYVASIDAEASDSRRDQDPVVSLWKVDNGEFSLLDGRTWSAIRVASGIEVNRGRWYTLSARMTAVGIALWLVDDATGNGTQVLFSPDATLPAGGVGVFVGGAAQFDDVRVNTTCAPDGFARGLHSNYATAVGSLVQHMCPPAYSSTGAAFRVCGDDGAWVPAPPLSCAPPPPVWAPSTQPSDGLALEAGRFPWFNRTLSEGADANAPALLGSQPLPILALPAPGTSVPLDVLYAIPTRAELGGGDNGNVDNATGLDVFSIDTCGGMVRVRNPGVLDFFRKPVWNITVWAYVVGEASARGFVQGNVLIYLTRVNRPPVYTDTTVYVVEGSQPFSLITPALTAFDREGVPAVFSIQTGNDLGLFSIGPEPPRIPVGTPSGQLSVAPLVNVGAYPGTQFCACTSRVLNFEATQSRYTLVVKVADGADASLFVTGTVTIVVNNTNDQPYQFPEQTRTVVDTSATAGAGVGAPLGALDEDGDALTWSIVSMTGGAGVDGSPAGMPVVPPGAWPFAISPTGGQLSMASTYTFNAAATPRNFNGFATRGIYRVLVRAADRLGQFDLKNHSVLVLANVTGGVTGTITDFAAPPGGLATAGGELVTVLGDYLPTTATRVFATYTKGAPADPVFTAPCNVTRPASGVSEPDMTMVCTTAPGAGSAMAWSFYWVNAANVTADIPASGTTQAITSYRPPIVSFLSAPSNASSPQNNLTLAVAGRLIIDLRAIDYIPGQWDNKATPGGISSVNGDFVQAIGSMAAPVLQTVAGAPAVVFSNTADSVNKALATDAGSARWDGIYGRSDW